MRTAKDVERKETVVIVVPIKKRPS
jgi:hypothetical protein